MLYCQFGRARTKTIQRKGYSVIDRMKSELESAPGGNIYAITFSGTGEPSLAI